MRYFICAFILYTMSTCYGHTASLNELINQFTSKKNDETQPAVIDSQSESIDDTKSVYTQIEEKIQEEFQKVYGPDKRIMFVNWRLPKFQDPKTGHWNLNESIDTNSPESFKVDVIEVSPDKTNIKAKVLYQLGKQEKTVLVRGRIDNLIEIPVLNKSLHYGDIITQDDIEWQKVSDRKSGRFLISKPEDLIGRQPKGKYIRAGVPINQQDVIMPVYVEKGSFVTVNYHSGKVELTLKAKALDKGHKGDTIRVLNETSHKIVYATVEGPSLVVME